MFSSHQQSAVGLDIGQSTVKAVAVARVKGGVRILQRRLFDCRQEGILDNAELNSHLPGWIADAGWRKKELVVSLPQYLVTSRITDFPVAKGQVLEDMVAVETRQLIGLSEESFVHDFCPLGSRPPERINPILIAICRTSVAALRAEPFIAAGLRLSEFGLPGVALASAYFHLYPELAQGDGLQLLVDIGAESTTLAIVERGYLLFAGSLLFGAHRYTQALAREQGIPEEEAEKRKRQSAVDPQNPGASLAIVTRALESELRTELEHWRTQQPPEVAARGFARVCLSGGGACLTGLDSYFVRSFGCETKIIGLPDENGANPDPHGLIALGLALQGAGAAAVHIALAPPEVRLRTRERRTFRQFLAALVLLYLTLGLGFLWRHNSLKDQRQKLTQRIEQLNQCSQLIPKLDDLVEETAIREKMLLPLVSTGNRARRYATAIDALAAAKGTDDFFIYLADNDTFRDAGAHAAESKEREERRPASGAGSGMSGMPMAGLPSLGSDIGISNLPPEFPTRIISSDVKPLHALVAVGATLLRSTEPYKPVREIVKKLNESPVFENVDLLAETELTGRADVFGAWAQALAPSRGKPRYKAFTLRVPYADVDVLPPTDAGKKK